MTSQRTVQRNDDGTYDVESKSQPGTCHVVLVLHGGLGYSCDCRGYHYRKWCDHCQQVKDEIGLISAPEIDTIDRAIQELLF